MKERRGGYEHYRLGEHGSLGTADVVIHIQGMGTVLREKSLVAYEHESG